MARRPRTKKAPKPWSPGDYEAERLIAEEQKRSPSLSRQGAALALVTRIRHEREPYSRSL